LIICLNKIKEVKLMAISLENLIDLNLLTYYDGQIKNYISNKIAGVSGSANFSSVTELPAEGKEDVLYVTDEGFKVWDPIAKKYTDLPNSGDLQTWDTF